MRALWLQRDIQTEKYRQEYRHQSAHIWLGLRVKLLLPIGHALSELPGPPQRENFDTEWQTWHMHSSDNSSSNWSITNINSEVIEVLHFSSRAPT
jgi:hypothetical protein